MTQFSRIVIAFAFIASSAACSDGVTHVDPGPNDDLQLSAAQATAIRNRIVQLAPVHPELAWLADSISLTVAAGATVEEVQLTSNFATGPFYAVSMQRTITTSFSASASFDVIMFNDLTNPTEFIVVGGWSNPGPGTPPTSVTGTFGEPQSTSTVTGHLFHVEGQTVTSWRVTGGTASFSFTSSNGNCSTVQDTESVTCQQAIQNSAFNITSSTSTTSTESRTATQAATNIGGIILRMIFE